jgi:hypothetical protein
VRNLIPYGVDSEVFDFLLLSTAQNVIRTVFVVNRENYDSVLLSTAQVGFRAVIHSAESDVMFCSK